MNIERLVKFNILYLDKKYLRVFVGIFFFSCLQISFISFLILISYCVIYRGIYLTVYNNEENYLKKQSLKVLGTILFISLIFIILITAFQTDSTQINESQNIIGSTLAILCLLSFLLFIILLTNISINKVNNKLKFIQVFIYYFFAPLFVLFIKDRLIKKTSKL